jgi:hypothetical protein
VARERRTLHWLAVNGFDAHLTKPADPAALARILKTPSE